MFKTVIKLLTASTLYLARHVQSLTNKNKPKLRYPAFLLLSSRCDILSALHGSLRWAIGVSFIQQLTQLTYMLIKVGIFTVYHHGVHIPTPKNIFRACFSLRPHISAPQHKTGLTCLPNSLVNLALTVTFLCPSSRSSNNYHLLRNYCTLFCFIPYCFVLSSLFTIITPNSLFSQLTKSAVSSAGVCELRSLVLSSSQSWVTLGSQPEEPVGTSA